MLWLHIATRAKNPDQIEHKNEVKDERKYRRSHDFAKFLSNCIKKIGRLFFGFEAFINL
jgi:hypothetical protein